MLEDSKFSCRIRDVIHGFVYLTECEKQVLQHPLFQRLRNVAHNDISSYVYPSLNTTRFEHSIGTVATADKMVTAISRGKHFEKFIRDIGADKNKFRQIVRLYALLHDLGHPPLSHLFESAFFDTNAPRRDNESKARAVEEWTGNKGFSELHESLGINITNKIFADYHNKAAFRGCKRLLLKLMNIRENEPRGLLTNDPCEIAKKIIASYIDADRLDSVKRDGTLAGSEYGNYDIERITNAVRIVENEGSWALAFDHRAVTSLESLLFERFRTFTRIHYHHRAAAFKVAARKVIGYLIKSGVISKGDFSTDNDSLVFRDDVWLWSLIRENKFNDKIYEISRDALLFRRKGKLNLLWKHHNKYREYIDNNLDREMKKELGPEDYSNWKDKVMVIFTTEEYEKKLSEHFLSQLGCYVGIFFPKLVPVGKTEVLLCDEKERLLKRPLKKLSPLVAALNSIWLREPQFYIIVIGDLRDEKNAVDEWARFTAKHFVDNIRSTIKKPAEKIPALTCP